MAPNTQPNNGNGKVSPALEQAQRAAALAKDLWLQADNREAEIQRKIAANAKDISTANSLITTAQKLLAADADNAAQELQKAQAAYASASARAAGLVQLLSDAQQAAAPLYADHQTKDRALADVQFVEEMAWVDKELMRLQQVEHDLRIAFEKGQRARHAMWERSRAMHLQQSEQRWQISKERMKAENRPVPGFERVRHAQL
jgi:paraquat-inducible protein B